MREHQVLVLFLTAAMRPSEDYKTGDDDDDVISQVWMDDGC